METASIDVDRVTFTLDLEDHRPSPEAPIRFPAVTERILDYLDQRDIRATVFVVGEVARDHPSLVTAIAERGHEIGLHAWQHVPLPDVGRDLFREETRRGRDLLRELTGQLVLGYRAPIFSLVRSVVWATDDLAELGFGYSSSVLPAASPLYGFPGAPTGAFRWPSGLLELPAPVGGIGPLRIPVMGGVYLRVVPATVRRLLGRSAGDRGGRPPAWLYCHPYDFDPGEPFWVVPDAGRWGSRLLWLKRRRMFRTVDQLLAGRAAPPLGERAAALSGRVLPTFDGGSDGG